MTPPIVSIVLPTFNRASMLAEGLESIATQSFTDWELIVVDDGSTDNNKAVVEDFRNRVTQPVTYIYQENQGPGVARQRALDLVAAKYVAFMDSDDPWLPHHLMDCVTGLENHSDVDWIVAPARVVNEKSGLVIHENSFHSDASRRAIFDLKCSHHGKLAIINDPHFVDHVITKGFPGGLQTSVFRRWIIDKVRIRDYRLFDDVAFQIESAGHGVRVGYFSEPHIIYRIHDQNVSLVNSHASDFVKRKAAFNDGVQVLGELAQLSIFTANQRKLLRSKIADMAFWDLGYSTYWACGDRMAAFRSFAKGLVAKPTSLLLWKSFLARLLWPFPPVPQR